jgi:hypothetical protein
LKKFKRLRESKPNRYLERKRKSEVLNLNKFHDDLGYEEFYKYMMITTA